MTATDHVIRSLTQVELSRVALRLFSNADIPRFPDGTPDRTRPWLWMGRTDRDGYGLIRVNNIKVRAHRLAFYLLYGYLPPVVRHLEPITADVNPYRLLPGDQGQNMRDREAHGTTARGARNGRSKLTPEKVREIRRAVDRGAVQAELARQHGVDPTTVRDIIRGKTWRDV